MFKINMKRSESEEQIAAFINVDAVNAVFVIYEKRAIIIKKYMLMNCL
jgi:hypothetical protein